MIASKQVRYIIHHTQHAVLTEWWLGIYTEYFLSLSFSVCVCALCMLTNFRYTRDLRNAHHHVVHISLAHTESTSLSSLLLLGILSRLSADGCCFTSYTLTHSLWILMWKFRIPEFIVIIKYLKWKQKEIVCGVVWRRNGQKQRSNNKLMAVTGNCIGPRRNRQIHTSFLL